MNKKKKGRKLSRKRNQRRALLKTLASSLALKEKIITTRAKAKEVSIFLEKAITLAKKQTLASRRRLGQVFSESVAIKIFKELGPRYLNRPGGYTRILRLGPRASDRAEMAVIELVK
jgi:large subunit ribosomal protein L17